MVSATERRFCLTKHVRERYLQRSQKRYAHLNHCQINDCEICERMGWDISEFAYFNERELNKEIYNRLTVADPDNSLLNDTVFMSWYYEKYGVDKRFEFLVHEDLVFIVVHDNGDPVVVTCINSKKHKAGIRHNSRIKFKKKTVEV